MSVNQLRRRDTQKHNKDYFQVEQKARREDVLNQLLLLLNTAINRKEREARASSGRGRRGSRKRGSKMEIILTQSMEEEDEEEAETRAEAGSEVERLRERKEALERARRKERARARRAQREILNEVASVTLNIR